MHGSFQHAPCGRKGRTRTRGLRPLWLVIAIDALLIGVTLTVFALFHHVLPRAEAAPVRILVTEEPAATPAATPAETPKMVPVAASSPTPAPTPSPSPAPGDFSATFPDYDTGTDAMVSFQTDDLRIAIRQDRFADATYYAADVWIRNIAHFSTAFGPGDFSKGTVKAQMPLSIADEAGALLALSGDYCGVRRTGLVIRNGVLYRDSVTEDVCVLYADGTMETYYRDTFDLDAAIMRGAYQSWSLGPKLIENGGLPASYDGAAGTLHSVLDHRDPRAAIGYYEPGHYCLLVVDGRQGEYSKGLTLTQLSELFLALGCTDAYNLDGGQTAAMVFDGMVVNRPYHDGRVVSDVICIS